MRPWLNRRLVLEAQAQTSDGAGGFDGTWGALGTVWGEIAARPGRDQLRGDLGQGVATVRIIVRATPPGAPSRPVPGQRFREGVRVFDILSVTDADAAGTYLVCVTREEVAR